MAPRIGPARAAAAGAFELPTMLAIGWLAFAEPLGAVELTAAALVIGAILLTPATAMRPGATSAHAPGTAP
jgi:drug/metabolite transporter (DMT)-like permease